MRDDKGRFVKGESGNPKGRAKREVELDYVHVLYSTVTLSDWRAIIEKAKGQALKGDAQARKWLSDYIMGLPVQRMEHGNTDDKPFQIEVLDIQCSPHFACAVILHPWSA